MKSLQQSAGRLLMVRPSAFGYNLQTAASNTFQNPVVSDGVALRAQQEFDSTVVKLAAAGLSVQMFDEAPGKETPDAVFPNNWISMHHDGTIILYPMLAPNRRLEVRPDIIERITDQHRGTEVLDLTGFIQKNQFLEGTGSIVFDHSQRVAYMALSERSHPQPLEAVCKKLGYTAECFGSRKMNGVPVYHTNVLLSIGKQFAILCSERLEAENDIRRISVAMEQSNRSMIEIDTSQMAAFAGNVLEVASENGVPHILISETAIAALQRNQKKVLENCANLLTVSIPTIEKHGGGGIRCMVAENFLPVKNNLSDLKIITPSQPADFERYFALRWEVLRKPWNQPPGSERDDLEDKTMHFMAVEGNKIAGTGRLQYNDEKVAQIRFMAVAPEFQGKGVGKKMMETMEKQAINDHRSIIFLQARENAVPFYQSLGYRIVEKTFLLYGEIQHYSMEKLLS